MTERDMLGYMKYKESMMIECIIEAKSIAKLEDSARPIIRNLIQLRLIPDSDLLDIWRGEIASYLNEVDRSRPLDGEQRYPDFSFILKHTYFLFKADIETLIEIIIRDFHIDTPNELELYYLKVDIASYFDWLAEKLSKYGSVARSDIIARLVESKF